VSVRPIELVSPRDRHELSTALSGTAPARAHHIVRQIGAGATVTPSEQVPAATQPLGDGVRWPALGSWNSRILMWMRSPAARSRHSCPYEEASESAEETSFGVALLKFEDPCLDAFARIRSAHARIFRGRAELEDIGRHGE
jgi:hypothetical protein